jgi:RNA-binding protein
MIKQVADALEARELFKISVLQNCEEDKDVVAEQLSAGTGAEIVQIIGNTIVLYKESVEKEQISLP